MEAEKLEAQFPILGGMPNFNSVPWSLVEPHAARALSNHGQPLWKLARRGGLSYDELLAVLEEEDLPRNFRRDPQAPHKVMAHMQKHRPAQNGGQ